MHASDLLPLAWLSLLALAIFVHLRFHPLNYVLKDGFRWIVSFPAPVLIYASSLIASGLLQWKLGTPHHAFPVGEGLPTFAVMFLRGFEDLAWIFHRAVIPLPFAPNTALGACVQALIASVSQVALCCYLVLTLQSSENLVRRTLLRMKSRWLGILVLAAIQWPWWYFAAGEAHQTGTLAKFLILEALFMLAPAPLLLAVSSKSLKEVFGKLGVWWMASLRSIGILLLTLVPLLALQAYALHLSEQHLLELWSPVQVLLRCVIVATLHTWIFICAALLFVSSAATASSNSQRSHS